MNAIRIIKFLFWIKQAEIKLTVAEKRWKKTKQLMKIEIKKIDINIMEILHYVQLWSNKQTWNTLEKCIAAILPTQQGCIVQ